MSVWRRAFLYLVRKPVRTFLLFLIFLALLGGVVAGVAVYSSAAGAIAEIKREYGTGFIVRLSTALDYPVLMDGGLSPEEGEYARNSYPIAQEIERSTEGIVQCNYEHMNFLNLPQIRWIPGLFEMAMQTDLEEDPSYFGTEEYIKDAHFNQTMEVYGNAQTELNEYFRTGALTVREGRHIQPDDSYKMLISENLAAKNGLGVGDAILVQYTDYEDRYPLGDGDPNILLQEWDYEVVGIYSVNVYQPHNDMTPERYILDNKIFSDLRSVREYPPEDDGDMIEKATFFVDDPARLDEIMAEVAEKEPAVHSMAFVFEPEDTMYRSATEPLERLSTLVVVLLLVLIVGCAIALGMVMSLLLRGRKREIGIYLALGISKGKIVAQMLVEALVVYLAAAVLASGLALGFAHSLGDALWSSYRPEETVASAPTVEELLGKMHEGRAHELFTVGTDVEPPEELDVVVSARQIVTVILAGLAFLCLLVVSLCTQYFYIRLRSLLS